MPSLLQMGDRMSSAFGIENRCPFLDKEIIRLSSGKTFEHWLKVHNDYLPSPRQRWCTRVMKIKPFEEFIKEDPVISYIGIRADEHREGYISQKPNIKPRFIIFEIEIFRLLLLYYYISSWDSKRDINL